jgi:hypothetical protein
VNEDQRLVIGDSVKAEIVPITVSRWIGICFTHSASNTWALTCPCGVTVTYALNALPLHTTKHPCPHPDHWSVQFPES